LCDNVKIEKTVKLYQEQVKCHVQLHSNTMYMSWYSVDCDIWIY